MPDLDSGHIFLTTLAPIKGTEHGGGQARSYEHNIRDALARLPTALQSPATQQTGQNSPFARNTRNHLARMFVLNDIVFNGRVGENALAAAVSRKNPVDPAPVDRLNAAYLVFCADIDAVTEDGQPLPGTLTAAQQHAVRASYARKLWETMQPELHEIYSNCVGFDGVQTADDFARYLDRCHVETTMPFHDYYLELPEFHRLPVRPLLAAVAIPAVVALVALLCRILGMIALPLLGWNSLATFVLAGALAAIAALAAVKYAIANGNKPLAPGKYDDLPSVLKALYMQQHFADFVVAHQGCTPETLHAAFGAFLERTQPQDRHAPTQPPGVIASVPVYAADQDHRISP